MSNDNDPISDLMSREGLSYAQAVEKLRAQLGATGDFPKGKLDEDDEGGITFAVTVQDDRIVRLDFGPKPVAWIGLDPEAAIAVGSSIINCAMSIKFQGAKLMREALGSTKQ